jgi:ABC-type antimicrobial peptide transport system permease subunit
VNSFGRLISQPAGMVEDDLWIIRGSLPITYRAPSDTNFWSSALREVRGLPQIASAAIVVNSSGPLARGDILLGGLWPQGRPRTGAGGFDFSHRRVSAGYFSTLGIPIVSGRPILETDTADSELVAVLNASAASTLWPGEDPLGKRLSSGRLSYRVVGIVPDFKLTRLADDVSGQMYTSYTQRPTVANTSAIVVRARPDTSGVSDAARAVLFNLERGMREVNAYTMGQVRWQQLSEERFRTAILLIFAATATFLTLVGMFGVVAYTVAQRRREIGLRVALGATARNVVFLLSRQALVPAAIGSVAGIAGAVAVSHVLTTFLFEIEPTDAPTFAAAAMLFLLSALIASLIPALNSLRIQPAEALRHE